METSRWKISQTKTFVFRSKYHSEMERRLSPTSKSSSNEKPSLHLPLQPEDNTRPGDYEKFLVELRKRDQFDRVIFSTFAIKVNRVD